MRLKKIVRKFWRDIDARRWDNLAGYFSRGARVDWPNTGESFDPGGFGSMKSAAPGYWTAEVEKVIRAGRLVVSVVRVRDNAESFHVTSFFTFKSKKIISLTEYWGEDGRAISQPIEDDVREIDTGNEPAGAETDVPPEAAETSAANKAQKPQKARIAHSEAPIVNIGAPAKKSAWTRLFFPDDAM
ncbi:MAG: hypothetical protein LBL73_00020 [Synergistaceae bacterium]|jgi:hypothetical protein|nr:hypothetical protein [Synergistaceae bacterium]